MESFISSNKMMIFQKARKEVSDRAIPYGFPLFVERNLALHVKLFLGSGKDFGESLIKHITVSQGITLILNITSQPC